MSERPHGECSSWDSWRWRPALRPRRTRGQQDFFHENTHRKSWNEATGPVVEAIMRNAHIAILIAALSALACDEKHHHEEGGGELEFPVGEAWGPCPIDVSSGVYTLCNSADTACVPADEGTAAICLPLDDCSETEIESELGWGGACYARCEFDDDCPGGMVCADSIADGKLMCAWPVSSTVG